MDKTVEIVVVAMVALVTGLAVLYLATGQAEGFGGFADDRTQSAQCDYFEERISRACQGEEADSLREEAPEDCTIEATPRDCSQEEEEDSSSNDDSSDCTPEEHFSGRC